MRRLLVVLVVVVAVVIVSVTWWKSNTRFESAPPPAMADSDSAVGETGLPDTKGRASLANSLQNPPASGVSASTSRHEAGRAQAMRITQVGRDKLLGRFQAEQVDGGWAASRVQSLTEHSVSPQIVDLKVQPRNFSATCRSATCRITADFASQSDAGDWFMLFLTNPGTDLANASFQTTPNPDGSTHAEIYGLARQ